ncbi:MAG: dTDP-4-dehydrorhamnose reductase [Bacteroidetes bacterium]|nr:dTDP-4-dehydrorhamnose reductase [Bacteroidota bacterium]
MRVVVTGRGGQLASELQNIMETDKNWSFMSEQELDITEIDVVMRHFSKTSCDFIINCAAYTNVDKAEDETLSCFDVNKKGVENLLEACKITGAKLIHYSTDYVFDGERTVPYHEKDTTNPIGNYGKSKLAGENAIKLSGIKSIIIRTSWVYSNYAHNFVKTMINLADHRKEIGIVGDQIGSPTNAEDLAVVTIQILQNNNYNWRVGEVFHYSNEGGCSWYKFGEEIFKHLKSSVLLNEVSTEDYPTKADRPKYSLLDKSKIKRTFGISIPTWQASLERMLQKELKNK